MRAAKQISGCPIWVRLPVKIGMIFLHTSLLATVFLVMAVTLLFPYLIIKDTILRVVSISIAEVTDGEVIEHELVPMDSDRSISRQIRNYVGQVSRLQMGTEVGVKITYAEPKDTLYFSKISWLDEEGNLSILREEAYSAEKLLPVGSKVKVAYLPMWPSLAYYKAKDQENKKKDQGNKLTFLSFFYFWWPMICFPFLLVFGFYRIACLFLGGIEIGIIEALETRFAPKKL